MNPRFRTIPRQLIRLPIILGLAFGLFTTLIASAAEPAGDQDALVFGTLPLTKPTKLLEQYKGLIDYYEKTLGQPVKFEIGKDYADAIAKFQSGHYDFGLLGPSPYVVATQTSPSGKDNFKLIGTLETDGKPYYSAVIVAAVGNDGIQSLANLKGKRFAFGSRLSTLACYLPADMLIQAGVMDELAGFEFIDKHDAVANAVSLGHFDAGGMQESLYNKVADKVKLVQQSEPVWDFMILAHKDMDPSLFERIKAATLELKDPAVLEKIKPKVTGFVATDDSNYDNLREIMKRVDAKLGEPAL